MIGDELKTCLECKAVTVKCLDGKILHNVKNRFLSLRGVIGALKIALASKLQPQGANWRVMNFVIIFPFFHLFLTTS